MNDLRGEVEHEVFENERYSNVTHSWGSKYPAHLTATDPTRWSNRIHGNLRHDDLANCPCIPGWEWTGDWRIDYWHAECDADGWRYAASFSALHEQLVTKVLPPGVRNMREAMEQPRALPTRWRRWVRPRRRLGGDGGKATRILKGISLEGVSAFRSAPDSLNAATSIGFGGNYEETSSRAEREMVPEDAIVYEGWLARYAPAGRWLTSWCILVRPLSYGVAARLLYCPSLEARRLIEELSCPPLPFDVSTRPNIPRQLALTITSPQLSCCFGIGSKAAAEGLLHCAPSPEV